MSDVLADLACAGAADLVEIDLRHLPAPEPMMRTPGCATAEPVIAMVRAGSEASTASKGGTHAS